MKVCCNNSKYRAFPQILVLFWYCRMNDVENISYIFDRLRAVSSLCLAYVPKKHARTKP